MHKQVAVITALHPVEVLWKNIADNLLQVIQPCNPTSICCSVADFKITVQLLFLLCVELLNHVCLLFAFSPSLFISFWSTDCKTTDQRGITPAPICCHNKQLWSFLFLLFSNNNSALCWLINRLAKFAVGLANNQTKQSSA